MSIATGRKNIVATVVTNAFPKLAGEEKNGVRQLDASPDAGHATLVSMGYHKLNARDPMFFPKAVSQVGGKDVHQYLSPSGKKVHLVAFKGVPA